MGIKWFHILGFVFVIMQMAFLALPGPREMGIMLSRGGQPKKAEPLIRQALQENPYDQPVVIEAGHVYTLLKQPELAEPYMRNYLERYPENQEVLYELASINLAQNDHAEAISALEKMDPTKKVHNLLYSAYQQTGKLDKAISLLKTSMEGTANDAERWIEISQLQFWQANVGGAAHALEEAASIAPKEETYLELLQLYEWLNHMDKARKAAESLAALPDLETETLRSLRSFQVRDRNLSAAVRAAAAVCKQTDTNERDWMDRAQLLIWSERPEDALKAFAAGIEHFPASELLLRQGAYEANLADKKDQAAEWGVALARLTGQPHDWLNAARLVANLGKLDQAGNILEAQLIDDDAPPQLLLYAGQLALGSGNRQKAITLAGRLSRQALADQSRLENIIYAAELLNQIGDEKMTAEFLQQLDRDVTNKPDLQPELAAAFARAGQVDQALTMLENSLDNPALDQTGISRLYAELLVAKYESPELSVTERKLLESRVIGAVEKALSYTRDNDLLITLADIYIRREEPDRAREILEQADNVPTYAWLNLANAYVGKGNADRSAAILKAMSGRTDSMPPADLAYLGYIHQQAGHMEQALEMLKLADAQSKGKDREIRLSLADLYGATGKIDKQYEIVDQLIKTYGDRQSWIDAADRRSWNSDRTGEALVLASALQAYPDSPDILTRQIRALAETGQHEKAKAQLDKLLARDDLDHEQTILAVAQALLAMENYAQAEELFERTLKINDRNDDAVLGLARATSGQEKYRRALRLYRLYLKENRDNGMALFELGQTKYALGLDGSYEQRRAFNNIRAIPPVELLTLRALAATNAGHPGQAMEYYQQARKLAPDNMALACDLADTMLMARQPEQAEALLTELAPRHPDHLRLHRLLAITYMNQEKYARALTLLQGLANKYPRNNDLRAELAAAEAANRNYTSARQEYHNILNNNGLGDRP